jgi:hypothetical protein
VGADRAGEAALRIVPEQAWQAAIDARGQVRERRADGACANSSCAHQPCWIEEAHVTELTPLLRCGPAGDQLALWPAAVRVFARRERPHPGAQLTLFEAEDGWRYTLWVTNRPATAEGWLGQAAYIDAAHRVHARVEDAIRTGKDAGLGHFPSHDFAVNAAWLTAAMTAQILLAWLRLLALDGDLAKAEPKTLRYRVLHAAARLVHGGRRRRLKSRPPGHGPRPSPPPGSASTRSRKPPDQHKTIPATQEEHPGARGTPGHPARQPDHRHTRALKSRSRTPARPPPSASHQPR